MLQFSFRMLVEGCPEIEGLKLRTEKQRKALSHVLANIWKYQTKPIYLRLGNRRNIPSRYNPAKVGNKPIKAVLDALRDLGLIDLKVGISRFTYTDDFEPVEVVRSSFAATSEFAGFLRKSIPSNRFFELPTLYIQYKSTKDNGDNLLNFEWCEFSETVNQQMTEYCHFMRQQRLTLDGEPLDEFYVVRTFRDWADDGSFLYGGRGWHSVMGMKKHQRAKILINGKATVALDYAASGPNILYLMMTGKRLYPHGDPYDVEGLERDVVKQYLTIMVNTPNIFFAEGAVSKWLAKGKERIEAKPDAIAAEKKLGSKGAVINAILKRNKPIAPCLMHSKAMGQHYQWLEANLVFHVAHQLSLKGIPALTVHDEFIVREEDKEIVEGLMYSTWPSDLPSLPEAPWNKSH